ncbi:hydrogenase [Gordonia sp. (in: high G+C Gram-positive bacteria)]|uniref:hydrogenase n=1 Tax=Gordonia sp. (in: high G+C Gram-positive bacteria) TaxID=84139 RepID=UPI002638C0DC|nr:hydrogenase [Gordonia sp. (in: high G+C Gram-positive bacteria)]
MQTLLFALGLVLFLLGLLTGLVNGAVRNPRMGLASHLQGMTNGPFLIIAGLLWPYLNLPHGWQVVTVVLLAYGTYANWLATQLAAIWGGGRRFAPAAAGDHVARPGRERVIDFLLASLAPAMIAATALLIAGVLL